MKNRFRLRGLCLLFLLAATIAHSQKAQGTFSFTVSMPQPGNHVYHVVFYCEGLKGAVQHLKMPVWSPGYYGIREFAKNVLNFRAQDNLGEDLRWEHVANEWKVETAKTSAVKATYDVSAASTFVADPYLGEDRGYILGTGLFMYVAGQITHPVTVEVKLNPGWKTIATGLDPLSLNAPHTFFAPDFDVLYDSPILMGNLESLPSFEIRGIPHRFIGYGIGDNFDADRFMRNLKAVVEQGIAVIGDIPYKHYTFLGLGRGAGGIEHLNSAAVPFTGASSLASQKGDVRQLNFLAHEYFHNYNVKRIRPIALGPFDYDGPNRTNMLWVSEGFTSYYATMMVARAGFMNREELLDSFRKDIASYENDTGHLFQSAAESSWSTWIQGPFGGRAKGGISKSVSYYSKGTVLGLLLDFAIRHDTGNRKSLDTVMQELYRKYYQTLKRGWTDEEFRAVCESVCGASLQEYFTYAFTTAAIDYGKYLGYAGLELEKPEELPDSFLGAVVEDVNGRLVVSAIESNSPAYQAGLAANDEIKSLDGTRVDASALNASVNSRKPGDRLRLAINRAGRDVEANVSLGHKLRKSFKIIPVADPNALQSAILADWMKAK
jgi:predicted metalloprotease with PDZ domain